MKCQGAKCRREAVHRTLDGFALCPTCFERRVAKDPEFKVKKGAKPSA